MDDGATGSGRVGGSPIEKVSSLNGIDSARPLKVLTVFGTRPEVIKVAPVIWHLERTNSIACYNVNTSQHVDIISPFIDTFGVRIDYDLAAMRPGQPLNKLIARIMAALDPIIESILPDLVLVQGDTTSALAGALAAFHRSVPAAHIEAGLRTSDPMSPFPEEMSRRLVSVIAQYHFAPTERNRSALVAAGVPEENIAVTGNPIVDSVRWALKATTPSHIVNDAVANATGKRLLVMTCHRRENFGYRMEKYFKVIRKFVQSHKDVHVIFPVHPNPNVKNLANEIFGNEKRIQLLPPLNHSDFLHAMSNAWLIMSDSGGVQEEVPTLGKPLIVLRDQTERPEVVESGVARLVGSSPMNLQVLLEEASKPGSWAEDVGSIPNPFGRRHSSLRVAKELAAFASRDLQTSFRRPAIGMPQ